MSKMISYQGYQLTPQTKIAIEALTYEAARLGLEVIIEEGDATTINLHDLPAFLKTKVSKYGFIQDKSNPHRYHFIGKKNQH